MIYFNIVISPLIDLVTVIKYNHFFSIHHNGNNENTRLTCSLIHTHTHTHTQGHSLSRASVHSTKNLIIFDAISINLCQIRFEVLSTVSLFLFFFCFSLTIFLFIFCIWVFVYVCVCVCVFCVRLFVRLKSNTYLT